MTNTCCNNRVGKSYPRQILEGAAESTKITRKYLTRAAPWQLPTQHSLHGNLPNMNSGSDLLLFL